MILRQFSSNQTYLLAVAPAMLLAVFLPAIGKTYLRVADVHYPIDHLLSPLWLSPYTIAIACILLIATGAMLVNIVFNRHSFFNHPTYLPALLYCLFSTGFCLFEIVFSTLLANIIVLGGLNYLLRVYRQPRALNEYFISGIFFGLSALIFPPYLLLLLGLWMSISYARAFNGREFIVATIAFAIPFIYLTVWKYWFRTTDDLMLFFQQFSFGLSSFPEHIFITQELFIAVSAITFLFSVPRFLWMGNRDANSVRNIKHVFFIISLTLLMSVVAGSMLSGRMEFLAFVIPLSFIPGYWFSNYRVSFAAPFVFYGLVGSFLIWVLAFFNP